MVNYKLVVLGEGGVGKSGILFSYTLNKVICAYYALIVSFK